jgi:TolB-like protein/Tfp pilus assembly protein PilF
VPTFAAPEWVMPTLTFVLILGFPLVLVVAWAFEITPEGIKKTAHVPLEESITHVTGQKLNYVVTALLAIAVVFLVIDNYVLDEAAEPRSDGDEAATMARPTGTRPAVEAQPESAVMPNSVAVLPFLNLSPKEDEAYFAAGIHEEILNQLAKLGNLNVIARTSVMRYAGSDKTIPEIARELNVGSVMEGSIRYADGQVLVTAQLIDAGTNVHLWSDSYQRDFSNIFGIQADIAMNVANALRAEFSPEEQRSIEELPTTSIEAYDHYLLARSLASQGFGGLGSGDAPQRAIAEYEQALALDPDFKLAKLGRAQSLQSLLILPPVDPNLRAQVTQAIDEVIELADELPAALGFVAQRRVDAFQWREAEQVYLDWLERAPANDYAANVNYGTFLKNVGRARESLPYLELARRKDPLLAGPSISLTMAYDAIGDTDRAVEIHNRMEALVGYDFTGAAPQFWRLLARDGDTRAASEVLARAGGSSVDEMLATLVAAPDRADASRVFKVFASNLNRPESGVVALHAVYDDPTSDNVAIMLNVALLAAYYGDVDLSVAALRRQARTFPALLQFTWTPLMQEVRSHPGFKSMLAELGLDDYWRAAGWPEHCRPVGAEDFTCS